MNQEIRIVFDGPPSHQSGRFVEVEDDQGRSISVGTWVERPDGLWELRIKGVTLPQRHTHVAGTTVGKHIDECATCGEDIRAEIHAGQ